jgi:Flp pilus assembly protein TadG
MTESADRGDDGMVTVWTAVVTLACLLMVGLVLDGGTILRARSRSFDLAGAAARAGVQQLDEVALTEGRVVLDQPAARRAVSAYLAAHDAVGEATVGALEVLVVVHETVDLQILRGADVTVTEAATARAEEGGV